MALIATRPTRAMSAMWAMPVTTVQKMIGAISMRMSLMKASPSGPICAARSGSATPSAMPAAMPISTQTQSWVHHGLALRALAGRADVTVIGPLKLLIFGQNWQRTSERTLLIHHEGRRASRVLKNLIGAGGLA